MAAGDIAVNSNWATIESDDTLRKITCTGVGGSLVNFGTARIFLGMAVDSLARDGLQHDGEIYLDGGDSIPVPAEAHIILHQCGAGSTSTLVYVPRLG